MLDNILSMKKVNIILVLIISLFLFSSGQTDIEQEIRNLIAQVKNAPPSERYKKMNQLKQFIKHLKTEERIKIMKKLHKQLEHPGGIHRAHIRDMKRKTCKNMPHEHMEMRNIKNAENMSKHREYMKERKNREHWRERREKDRHRGMWKW